MSFSYVLGITFLGPMASGDTISMKWTGASGTIVTAVEGAVPTRTGGNEVSIGTDAITQATNFYTAVSTDYAANFNVTGNSGTDTVYISSMNTTNPMSGFTTSSNVVFNYTGSPITNNYDIQDLRARSPYMLVSTATTANTFTNAVYTIKQYEDLINTFPSQPISYVKTKDKITSTQSNIWINLSNLLREDLEADVSYFQDADFTVARNLSLNESKWAHIDTTLNFINTFVSSGQTNYFVVDGYIEPSETQGLPNILMTGDKRYIYRGSNDRIYFKTQDLTAATYTTSTSPTPTTITYSGSDGYNYGYVKSVKVDNDGSTADWVKYSFTYSSASTQNVTVYFYDECKYDVYDLVFKNKYGMMEAISMSKKSSKVLNVTSSEFLRSIVDYEGDFNINRHTSKQFNVAGTEEWILNTEFLPEYMNAPIKEAMLSEEMWLIDNQGAIIPVIRVDNGLAFKTSLNDKMIQYTLKVRLSHNTIKNII